MRAVAFVLALLPLACSHDLSALFGPEVKNREAHALLEAADMRGARAAYELVLRDYPSDGEALFGAALTDLMLLPESAPVSELLAICHQSPPDLAAQLFGANGIISQSVASGEGNAQVAIHYFPGQGGGASDLDFAPSRVLTQTFLPTEASPRHEVFLTVRERDVPNPRWLYLQFNPDDLEKGDETITEYRDGAEVAIERLDGAIQVIDFQSFGRVSGEPQSPSGRLRFVRAGKKAGEPIEVDFLDVRIPAACGGSCGPDVYGISGSVVDVISPPLEFDTSRIPFATVQADSSSPRREEMIVALDNCSAFDDRFVATRVRSLADLVVKDADRLGAILSSRGASSFSFALPAKLFRAKADLPINLSDVRTLRGALLVLAAAAGIAAEYQYLNGDLTAEVEQYQWWENGETTTRLRRGFFPAALAMHLELGFLVKPQGFDLSLPRQRLKEGLLELAAALVQPEQKPGLLTLHAAASGRLIEDLSTFFDVLGRSIDSAEPLTFPKDPLYQAHLARFFDDPLDADRIRQLTGLVRLWDTKEGTPDGMPESRRNPSLVFKLVDQLSAVGQWSNGMLRYPPVRTTNACSAVELCDAGYQCAGTICELSPPWFASSAAWQSATTHDWPAFVGAALRDAIAFDN